MLLGLQQSYRNITLMNSSTSVGEETRRMEQGSVIGVPAGSVSCWTLRSMFPAESWHLTASFLLPCFCSQGDVLVPELSETLLCSLPQLSTFFLGFGKFLGRGQTPQGWPVPSLQANCPFGSLFRAVWDGRWTNRPFHSRNLLTWGISLKM